MSTKEELVKYLKTKHFNNIQGLWGETKYYYKNRLIEMGGGFASFGDYISVVVNIDGKQERFKVYLNEFNLKK